MLYTSIKILRLLRLFKLSDISKLWASVGWKVNLYNLLFNNLIVVSILGHLGVKPFTPAALNNNTQMLKSGGKTGLRVKQRFT